MPVQRHNRNARDEVHRCTLAAVRDSLGLADGGIRIVSPGMPHGPSARLPSRRRETTPAKVKDRTRRLKRQLITRPQVDRHQPGVSTRVRNQIANKKNRRTDSRWFWHNPARRSEAKAVRESLLFVTGELVSIRDGCKVEAFNRIASPQRSLYLSCHPEFGDELRLLEFLDARPVRLLPAGRVARASTEVAVERQSSGSDELQQGEAMFRFLVLVGAVSGLALCSSSRADEAEDRAVAVVEKLGGSVTRDEQAPDRPVVRVSFFRKKVSEAELKELAPLKGLTTLLLHDAQVTDAGVKEVARFKGLTTLALSSAKLTDAGLKELQPLKELGFLDLSYTKVTDAGLKELATHTKLSKLVLVSTQVTNAGLKELAALPGLTEVDLGYTQVTDTGLRELNGCKSLTRLVLRDKQVTDATLKVLREMNKLHTLANARTGDERNPTKADDVVLFDLFRNQVTDAGLKELVVFKELTALNLPGTLVTDAGMKDLVAHKKLTFVNLIGTQVTDAGLKELTALKGLKRIFIGSTRVTDEGVKEFEKALPTCEIVR